MGRQCSFTGVEVSTPNAGDGRKVYSPSTNTVFWDRLDTYLPDIQKIEIIRGPGASLWGGNASNGIINIVTRHSRDTNGLHAYVQAADEHLAYDSGIRFGFSHSSGSGRVYVKQKDIANSVYPADADQSRGNRVQAYSDAHDSQSISLAGFRLDYDVTDNIQLQVSGEYVNSETEEVKVFSLPVENSIVEQEGASLLARMNIQHANDYSSIFHVYVDHLHRDTEALKDSTSFYDFDYQGHKDNQVLSYTWGLGIRRLHHYTKNLDNTFGQALFPRKEKLFYKSAFAQLEYFLLEKVNLTLGFKVEDDPYTGLEFMPNLRVGYYPKLNTTYWGSISKAVSTPSRSFADGYLDLSGISDCSIYAGFGAVEVPGLGCAIGVADRDSLFASSMMAYEIGHRRQLSNRVYLDQTLYYNEFSDLNDETLKIDRAYGYEISVRHNLSQVFGIDVGLNYQKVDNHMASSIENLNMTLSGFSKLHYRPSKRLSLSFNYRYLEKTNHADRYDQLGFTMGYDVTNRWKLTFSGKDLLDDSHIEPNADTTRGNSVIQRSFFLKVEYAH